MIKAEVYRLFRLASQCLLCLSGLLLLQVPNLMAAPEVQQGVLSIESDHAAFDPQQAKATYTGNVIITRSDLSIQAERAVFTEATPDQPGTLAISGSPVRFTLETTAHTAISGHATMMHYDLSSNIVELRQQAWIQQGNRQFSGDVIVYNINTQYMVAKSHGHKTTGDAANHAATRQSDRVKVLIYPDQQLEK